MLTAVLPATILIVALIYLPIAGYQIWKIHSAQRIIEHNHSLPTTQWKFQQKEYDSNERLLTHYCTYFTVFCWIATCCVLELSVGHYVRFDFLDYCILFAGSIGAVVIYAYCKHGPAFDACMRSVQKCWVTKILGFCTVIAFQWELAAAIAFCGLAWHLSPYGPRDA